MAESSIPSEPPPDYEAAIEHGAAQGPLRPAPPVRKAPLPLELPILKYLKSRRVILASASPRRKALLAQVRIWTDLPLGCLSLLYIYITFGITGTYTSLSRSD